MKYEFMSIALTKDVTDWMKQADCDELNKYFSDGWEFVDSICQAVSASAGRCHGAVIVILKREKM
ncbi:MAG: hypothetical protein ABR974_01290 [Bacteroidales bacterium]|jgi:hypothetical protein